MNAIGFDAMALGNHEFDDGPDVLAEFVRAADFPVISGNTRVGEGEALAAELEENVSSSATASGWRCSRC
jgi:5'-nucleotidase / UDP-sugar diphosphatase